MNARSAVLVAVTAVLAGGAWWLVRGTDGRARRAAVTLDGSTREVRSEALSESESKLAPAPSSNMTARSTAGEPAQATLAVQGVPKPTRLNVRVLRTVPKVWRAPVPNARVQIIDTAFAEGRPGWTLLTEGETNAKGVFTFDPPRALHATVRAEATIDGRKLFGVSGMLVAEASESLIEVELEDEPRGDAHVTVIDRDTLLPIAGADVRPTNGDEPITTNPLGEFTAATTNGDLSAWVGAAGYFPVMWHTWDPRLKVRPWRLRSPNDPPPEADLRPASPKPASVFLHRSALVRGTVVDARGRSIAGVRLKTRVFFLDEPAYEVSDVVAETDDHGRFAFAALPAGLVLPLELTASGETVRADIDSLELAPGETRTVTLRIRGHVELSGRVLDGKDELVRAGLIEVSIEGRTDKSPIRSDGTYYLPFAVAGSGWITVTREAEADERVEPQRVPIVIPFDIAEWTCDVRLIPATSIAGVFVDAENRPAEGVLSLMRGATAVDDTIVRNERGVFRFEAVALGAYTVWGIEGHGAKRSVKVDVHAGDQNVLVRLPSQGVVVGRVVDASGAAVSGAEVSLEPSQGLFLEQKSAPDGGFRAATPIGSVWVSAQKGDLQSPLARVLVGVEGESSVPDLVLAPSAPLRFMAGRLAQPAQVEVVSDAGVCFSGSLPSYADRKIRVPLGRLRISVTYAGKPQELRTLEMRTGEIAVVPIVETP